MQEPRCVELRRRPGVLFVQYIEVHDCDVEHARRVIAPPDRGTVEVELLLNANVALEMIVHHAKEAAAVDIVVVVEPGIVWHPALERVPARRRVPRGALVVHPALTPPARPGGGQYREFPDGGDMTQIVDCLDFQVAATIRQNIHVEGRLVWRAVVVHHRRAPAGACRRGELNAIYVVFRVGNRRREGVPNLETQTWNENSHGVVVRRAAAVEACAASGHLRRRLVNYLQRSGVPVLRGEQAVVVNDRGVHIP